MEIKLFLKYKNKQKLNEFQYNNYIDDRNGGNHFSKAPTNSFPFTGPVNVVGWTQLLI